jgi:hypothetical protein
VFVAVLMASCVLAAQAGSFGAEGLTAGPSLSSGVTASSIDAPAAAGTPAPSALQFPPSSLPAPLPLVTRSTPAVDARTDVSGAIVDSFKQLAWEHGIRVAFQDKTRRELGGSFWRDYKRSIRVPHQWEDGDSWLVNYIGHPIHGASAGYSWIDHGPEASREIGLSRGYWMGRARTLAWTAGYSLQFEFGPLSEASIGNVGSSPETTGWVDHVVTPIGAFGLIVAEDALDRYFVKWVERRTANRFYRATLRLMFNPARTMSNTLRGRAPWHRPGRPLAWDRGQ